jgi:hypothetical protein
MVGFIRSGKEGNSFSVRLSGVGEETGSEGVLSDFESREDGKNGILFMMVSN